MRQCFVTFSRTLSYSYPSVIIMWPADSAVTHAPLASLGRYCVHTCRHVPYGAHTCICATRIAADGLHRQERPRRRRPTRRAWGKACGSNFGGLASTRVNTPISAVHMHWSDNGMTGRRSFDVQGFEAKERRRSQPRRLHGGHQSLAETLKYA